MTMKEKERYLSPDAELTELSFEGLLCLSDPNDMGTGDLPGFSF